MTDISETLLAKSDQLNAADLAVPRILTITSEDTDVKRDQQPVWLYYEGGENRPWKPCKTARRILAAVWKTTDTKDWVGRSVSVLCDPTVIYAGVEVGGVRPNAVSHIDAPVPVKFREGRGKPKTFLIQPLRMSDAGPKSEPVQFSMDVYGRAIEKIMSESKTADELSERFDRMTDWRKQAAQTDRDKATEYRERVTEKISALRENID